MVTVTPTPYVGLGLLGDDERNTLLSQFAGGLLQGYTVNPTRVDGRFFTPTNTMSNVVTGGSQTPATMLTQEDLDRMMQDRANRLNLLNEGGAQDDFDFAPPEADPGVYDGSLLDFISDPNGLLSAAMVPGFSILGTLKGAFDVGRSGRSFEDLARGRAFAYDTSEDDLEDAMGLTGGDVGDPAAMGSDPSFDFDLGAPEEEDDGFGGMAI